MTSTEARKSEVVDIPNVMMKYVADIINFSWDKLIKNAPNVDICNSTEDQITQALCNILGELYVNPPKQFEDFSQWFQTPVREGNVENFDNTHPDKQPDLTFRPQKDSIKNIKNANTVAIFIECKPITQQHSLLSHYCKKGLIRYINGDYSWQVNKALMIGYVKNNKKLPKSLADVFNKLDENFSSHLLPEHNTSSGNTVYSSLHDRNFLLDGKHDPGKIRVDHLWLHTNDKCS